MPPDAAPATVQSPAADPAAVPAAAAPEAPLAAAAPPAGAPPSPAPSAPAGTDQPPAAPQPDAQKPGALTPELQQYVDQLEQQAATSQERADRALLADHVRQDAARLEREMGLTPEQAAQLAKQRGDWAWKSYQDRQIQRGRVRAALSIGRQYQVDPMDIVDLPTPEAMAARAQELIGHNSLAAQLKALQEENAGLKKRLAPPQTFATAQGAADGTRATVENIDVLYAQDPARWEAKYREFLHTGRI